MFSVVESEENILPFRSLRRAWVGLSTDDTFTDHGEAAYEEENPNSLSTSP